MIELLCRWSCFDASIASRRHRHERFTIRYNKLSLFWWLTGIAGIARLWTYAARPRPTREWKGSANDVAHFFSMIYCRRWMVLVPSGPGMPMVSSGLAGKAAVSTNY